MSSVTEREIILSHQKRFLDLAAELSSLAQREGIPLRAWRDPETPSFLKLSEARQVLVLDCLTKQVQVSRRFKETGKTLLDSWAMCREMLTALGYTTDPDLINFVEPEDYIAIYNQHHSMMFATPNHFSLVSYGLEDLYCRSWMDMFRRDRNIEKVLVERAMSFVTKARTQILSNEDIPPHFITEVDTIERRKGTCRSKVYSPIFRDGEQSGYISINRGVPVAFRAMPRPPIAN